MSLWRKRQNRSGNQVPVLREPATNISMSKNLQKDQTPIEGSWWEPSNPGAKWHGTLVMKAGNHAVLRALELETTFLNSSLNRVPYSRSFLHGVTKDGAAVTLWKCITSHRSRSMGSEETHFDVHTVIFGGHFTEKDLVFDEVKMTFDYLNDWIGYSRYKTEDLLDSNNRPEQINILIQDDHQFPFQAPEYKEAEFYIGYRTHTGSFKFSIRSLASLHLTYAAPKPLEDILRDMHRWDWFFTLATDHQNHLSSLCVGRDDLRIAPGIMDFKEEHDVWVKSVGMRKHKRSLRDGEMVFTLSDIQKDLSSVVTRWNAIQVPWAAVLHRYFASIHRQSLQLQEQFLFRAQAVEALHRARTGVPKVLQKDAYPSAWENAPKTLQEKLGTKDAFVESLQVNRNYLTHYSPKDEKNAADIPELFDLAQKLRFIIEAAILVEIGIPENTIEGALGKSRWGELIKFDEGE